MGFAFGFFFAVVLLFLASKTVTLDIERGGETFA